MQMQAEQDTTMRTYNQNSHSGDYKEDDVAVTITVLGGTYGGGSEVLVVAYGFDGYNQDISEEVAQPLRSHGGATQHQKL